MSVEASVLQDAKLGAVDALDMPCSDCQWKGNIRRQGELWAMQAQFSLRIRRRCDRCLRMFDWALRRDCERFFLLDGLRSEEDELEDVVSLPAPGRLNLLDLLREEIWLSWQPVSVCHAECRGLCPHCGVDRNDALCDCDGEQEEHPFAALRRLQLSDR